MDNGLAAALATYETADFIPAQVRGVVIAAARERLRLSRIPCADCESDGTGLWNGQKVWEDGYMGQCPSCGGSGEVWDDELVEAAGKPISDYAFANMTYLDVDEDVLAVAVLDAVEKWMEAK